MLWASGSSRAAVIVIDHDSSGFRRALLHRSMSRTCVGLAIAENSSSLHAENVCRTLSGFCLTTRQNLRNPRLWARRQSALSGTGGEH